MSDNTDDNNDLPLFFLGLGLGVAVGLLFAPKSGSETRDLLMSKADEGRKYLLRNTEGLRDSASDLVDKGKDALSQQVEKGRGLINQQKDNLNAAVEAGKQAYRDTVGSAGQQPKPTSAT